MAIVMSRSHICEDFVGDSNIDMLFLQNHDQRRTNFAVDCLF